MSDDVSIVNNQEVNHVNILTQSHNFSSVPELPTVQTIACTCTYHIYIAQCQVFNACIHVHVGAAAVALANNQMQYV